MPRDLHSRAVADSLLGISVLPASSSLLASAEGKMKPNSQQLWLWTFRYSKIYNNTDFIFPRDESHMCCSQNGMCSASASENDRCQRAIGTTRRHRKRCSFSKGCSLSLTLGTENVLWNQNIWLIHLALCDLDKLLNSQFHFSKCTHFFCIVERIK